MERNWREGLEDLLEAVWLRRELGQEFDLDRYRLTAVGGPSLAELTRRLQEQGLLVVDGSRAVLTPAGEEQAAKVVRRHRLAERLFHDLLSTHPDETTGLACRFEHILNEEVTEAVCSLLGHPTTCPHGRHIPPGPCCRRDVREVKALVKPLTEFDPGQRARIVFIAPSIHQRLDRLASFGILPRAVVHLHQRQPSFVLRLGATEVALEKDVAREIYAIRID